MVGMHVSLFAMWFRCLKLHVIVVREGIDLDKEKKKEEEEKHLWPWIFFLFDFKVGVCI
jgi:hypothetical protein